MYKRKRSISIKIHLPTTTKRQSTSHQTHTTTYHKCTLMLNPPSLQNKTTDVVIQQHSRKLPMMDILMSETCWAHKKWNKIPSDIKLVFYSSTKILHVSESCSVHHQEFFTLHTAVVYVIQIFWQQASRIRTEFRPDPVRKLSANMYDILLLYAQWKIPDDGQRNCPKYVEFYSKNKFEKLVHLVGFVIRIYHDARSSERQIPKLFCHFRRGIWWGKKATPLYARS